MAKLTTKAVEAIKPTTARKEIPDALLPGLYLIVQPSGARSWAGRYRHNGKPRKHTLGPFPAIDLKAARTLLPFGDARAGERRAVAADVVRLKARQVAPAKPHVELEVRMLSPPFEHPLRLHRMAAKQP